MQKNDQILKPHIEQNTTRGHTSVLSRFFQALQRQLELFQRRLRNKKKGSKNRRKLNQKIVSSVLRSSQSREYVTFPLDRRARAVDFF